MKQKLEGSYKGKYILLHTFYNKQQLFLAAILDVKHPDNSITIKDIMTDVRVAQILYNLGLKLTYKRVSVPGVGEGYMPSCEVNALKVYTEVFNSVATDATLAQLAVAGQATTTRLAINDMKQLLPDASDSICTELGSRIYADYAEMFKKTSTGELQVVEYKTYTSDTTYLNRVVYNDTYKNHEKQAAFNDQDVIDFYVPEFCEIISAKKAAIKEDEEAALTNGESTQLFGVEPSEETTEDVNTFSCYEDIYKICNPMDRYGLGFRLEVENKGNFTVQKYLPTICPDTLNVASVTPFYDFYFVENMSDQEPDRTVFNKIPDSPKYYHREDLTGHVSNNEAEIFSNEQGYFNKLCQLVDVGISIENNLLAPASFEKFKKMSPDIDSSVAREYLKAIAEQAFDTTWVHTGQSASKVDRYEESDDDDDNDNGISSMEFGINFKYGSLDWDYALNKFVYTSRFTKDLSEVAIQSLLSTIPHRGTGFDGNIGNAEGGIVAFVDTVDNRYRWPEAVIKLMRFGRNKPKILNISRPNNPGIQRYWDLAKCCVTTFKGNKSAWVPVVDPDTGSTYTFNSIVTTKIVVKPEVLKEVYADCNVDNTYSFELPVGVSFKTEIKDEDITLITYMDIFDLAKKVMMGATVGITGDAALNEKYDVLSYDSATQKYIATKPLAPIAVSDLEDAYMHIFKIKEEVANTSNLSFKLSKFAHSDIFKKRYANALRKDHMMTKDEMTQKISQASRNNEFSLFNVFHIMQAFNEMDEATQLNILKKGMLASNGESTTGKYSGFVERLDENICYVFFLYIKKLIDLNYDSSKDTVIDILNRLDTSDVKTATATAVVSKEVIDYITSNVGDYSFYTITDSTDKAYIVLGLAAGKHQILLLPKEFTAVKAAIPQVREIPTPVHMGRSAKIAKFCITAFKYIRAGQIAALRTKCIASSDESLKQLAEEALNSKEIRELYNKLSGRG